MNLYKFYTDTCVPCRQMSERIKDVDFMLDYGVVLNNINAHKDPDKAALYGIKTVPTFVLTDDNDNMIRKINGSISLQELDTFITSTDVP